MDCNKRRKVMKEKKAGCYKEGKQRIGSKSDCYGRVKGKERKGTTIKAKD